MQGLLLLKKFSLNHQFLYWFPESLLQISCRLWRLGPSEDVPGMECAAWVGKGLFIL